MLSKSQARAFFFGGNGISSVAFFALTIDSMHKLPNQTNADNITEKVRRGKQIWEDNNCTGLPDLVWRGCLLCAGVDESRRATGKGLDPIVPQGPASHVPRSLIDRLRREFAAIISEWEKLHRQPVGSGFDLDALIMAEAQRRMGQVSSDSGTGVTG